MPNFWIGITIGVVAGASVGVLALVHCLRKMWP